MRRARRVVAGVGAALGVALTLGGLACAQRADAVPVSGGDVERGRVAIAGFGCGACHTIGGIAGANGKVGPPLTGVASRSILAGQLPNTPENMIRWIVDPPRIEPGTAMPNLHVPEQSARDIVAYLYATQR